MRVLWTRPALADLDRIQDFVARESPAAAYALVRTLVGRTERLLSNRPMSGRRVRAEGTREFVVSGTPYIVV